MVAGIGEQEGMGSKIFPFFVEFYWNFSWKCDYLIYWYDKEIILMIIFQIVRLLIFCDNKELCISNHQIQIPFIGLRNQSTWAQSNSPTHFELPQTCLIQIVLFHCCSECRNCSLYRILSSEKPTNIGYSRLHARNWQFVIHSHKNCCLTNLVNSISSLVGRIVIEI